MSRRPVNILCLLPGFCFLLCRCVQTYVSPYVSPVTGYLVVEGYMSGNTPSQFTLSRTIPLPGDSTIPVVTGASLQIEGNDNSIEYSIIVTQSSLTVDGYNYLYLMQLNNESPGSIFDVQPSAPIGGNIHSLSNSNETVIGYVSAGTIQQQRIFIKRSQLSSWLYIYECQQPDKLVQDNPDSLLYYFNYWGYTPIQEVKPGLYSANYPECIDCTWQGGITTKPSFWPN
jgi:hypothetical protein